ncbi:MAG: acyltransferase domain-containing protein, partial [Proteobacteria bacterium]
RASLDKALALKPNDIDLAAANGAMQQVFSGPVPSIERFAEDLLKEGIASRRLESRHAFHSWMVEDICETLRRELETVAFAKMTIPLISTVHGNLLSESEAKDPRYWSQHARVPVRFQAALQTASAMGDILLAEIGPRLVATNLARKELSSASLAIGAIGDEREVEHFLKLMAQLWVLGVIEAEALQTSFTEERAPGVSYVFQKTAAFVAAMKTSPISPKGEPHMRVSQIREDIRALVEESSGELIEKKDDETHFTELGLDSLFLTQLSLQLRNRFKIEISFRQLSEELSSVQSIAGFIDSKLPNDPAAAPAAPAVSPSPQAKTQVHTQTQSQASAPQALQVQASVQPFTTQQIMMPTPVQAPAGSLNAIFSQQLSVIQQQLALLGGQSLSFAPSAHAEQIPLAQNPHPAQTQAAVPESVQAPKAIEGKEASDDDPSKKVFGAMAKISKVNDKLGPLQRQSLDSFQKAYNEKTKSSKAQTQAARSFMADPRVVTG